MSLIGGLWLAIGAVAAALDAAGLSRETQFEAACLGLSGGPADKEALAREIVRAKQYRVTHDADVALTGATGGSLDVVVTGSAGGHDVSTLRQIDGLAFRTGLFTLD